MTGEVAGQTLHGATLRAGQVAGAEAHGVRRAGEQLFANFLLGLIAAVGVGRVYRVSLTTERLDLWRSHATVSKLCMWTPTIQHNNGRWRGRGEQANEADD
jgi:hypothetical protein